MTEITQIGFGLMGSALARSLSSCGQQVTVWNRSRDKVDAIVSAGAKAADSIAAGIQASPIVLVCIDSYATTRTLLAAEGLAPLLNGKTLIQLSTGTPREAREIAHWVRENDCRYLDGKILCGPEDIGREGRIVVSGTTEVFENCRPILACLAGDLRHVGEDAGAAATMDLAWLSGLYGLFLGALHGICLCEAERVDLVEFGRLYPETDHTRWLLDIVVSGNYQARTATLQVWYEALRRLCAASQDAGISVEVPDFIAGLFQRALAHGYGSEELAALIKSMRSSSSIGP
jgi:3-hydroxyisobutyrate dehydrogenase-like beta-hydroxyacid dehydrogenase